MQAKLKNLDVQMSFDKHEPKVSKLSNQNL